MDHQHPTWAMMPAEERPQRGFLSPPPPPNTHPYLRSASNAAYTNNAARAEAKTHKDYLKGLERRRQQQQRLAQMRLGQQVDPRELEDLFREDSDALNPVSVFKPATSTRGLPGLARRLAKAKLEVPVPHFEFPKIQFGSNITLQSLIELAEWETSTPSQRLWVVFEGDQTRRIKFRSLLKKVTKSSEHPFNQIYLIRDVEFEDHKDRLLNFINSQFTEAYSKHYKKQFEERYKNYIAKLEDHLKESAGSISSLNSHVERLQSRNSQLKQSVHQLEQEKAELNRQIWEMGNCIQEQNQRNSSASIFSAPQNPILMRDSQDDLNCFADDPRNALFTGGAVTDGEFGFNFANANASSFGNNWFPDDWNRDFQPNASLSAENETPYADPGNFDVSRNKNSFANLTPPLEINECLQKDDLSVLEVNDFALDSIENLNNDTVSVLAEQTIRPQTEARIQSSQRPRSARTASSATAPKRSRSFFVEESHEDEDEDEDEEEEEDRDRLRPKSLLNQIHNLIQENPDGDPNHTDQYRVMTSLPKSAKLPDGTWGKIVDEDEVGPIFDYSELAVGMRGGADSLDDLEDSQDDAGRNFTVELSQNIGIMQRIQHLQDEDDEVDFSIPVMFNGVPVSLGTAAKDSFLSSRHSSQSQSSRWGSQKYSHRNTNSGHGHERDYNRRHIHQNTFAPAFADLPVPNSNEHITGVDFFRPLASYENSFTDTSSGLGSSALIEKDCPSITPLSLTLGSVFNAASELGSRNSTPSSSTHGHGLDMLPSTDTTLIEPIIEAQSLRNDELHLAQKPITEFERLNRQYLSRNTGTITMQIGDETVTYVPKHDKRLRDIDENGDYRGGEWNLPKKRLLKGLKEQIRERHRQLYEKSAEYRFFSSLSKEERARIWAQRNKPLKYWQGKPGADSDDQIEVEQIPTQYVKVYNRYKKRKQTLSRVFLGVPVSRNAINRFARPHVSSGRDARDQDYSTPVEIDDNSSVLPSESDSQGNVADLRPRLAPGAPTGWSSYGADDDDNHNTCSSNSKSRFNGRDIQFTKDVVAVQGRIAKRSALRSDEEAIRLIRDLCLDTIKFPLPGSTTSQKSHSRPNSTLGDSDTFSTAQATGSPDNVFEYLYDGPELQTPEDSAFRLQNIATSRAEAAEKKKDYDEAIAVMKNNPRAVLVRLHSGPKYTPGAIAKRIFGGIIQEIQLHEKDRAAVVIFLYPAEAQGLVDHIATVKKNGIYQEIASLQIEVDWYNDDRIQSTIPLQSSILHNAIFADATRALRLDNICLTLSRERVFSELGVRLGKLLISIVLVTPSQRYKQASEGRQAIIEFCSIKDAIESRQALLEGKIEEYENCAPQFAEDPAIASENYSYKQYCDCLGCQEWKEDINGVSDV